ncbi:hypothetical protein AQUCO_00700532v1 [Aquilegia coerulea]|uniref:GYF domain-containing protein n=1 Tax=Aquilegia coerulea TaxID=218851 RepID=A0A2G5EL12_AQUCA|nr:hypothetical protein AQUCO_00700532v1 [Aquilegia coerulea]
MTSKRKRGRPAAIKKEEVAEDWCFECKDGGDLLICDFKQCMKAYHLECLEKAKNKLETGKRWICDWHLCLSCSKSSTYRCFVCKNAVCKKCIKYVEFVHVRGKHGFCNDCLYYAMLVEENADVHSDGVFFAKIYTAAHIYYVGTTLVVSMHIEKVFDLSTRSITDQNLNKLKEIMTTSILISTCRMFRVTEHVGVSDVRSADIRLKKGEWFRDEVDTDKFVNGKDEDQDFDESMESDDEICSLMVKETKWLPPRKHAKKGKQKRREFMGWGSKSLIEFLKSIGKDSITPICQNEVRDIILEYIRENKLIHPEKKKKVLCDIKLQSIFSRKSINRNKIYDLLERHFAENMEQSEEDDYSCNSDEKDEDTIMNCKMQTRTSLRRRKDEKENVLETPRSCYASITDQNIKLIYLKKTLIEDFLMTPETFDDKVMGSFVRVKSNPNDYFQKNVYQLLQVTGITKAQGTKNITGEVTLRLSNTKEDIQICKLSDDNFLEEEIEELRQRIKNGLLKRLTIVELEQKARRLHVDLTEHWIKKELALLQKLIDQANEKGWRKELCEYFDRKELLQTPSERQRLLQEIPKVIAEEIEIEVNPLDLPKGENPVRDNSPRSILFPRDSVSADNIAGSEDAIIVNADIKATRDLCKIEVNRDDTDNRTDDTVAKGTEADITVNAQVTPGLSVIEVSGDGTNEKATESTAGTEDAIIANVDIELTPHLSVIEVNVDDSDKRTAEKIAEGVEDVFSVNADSEVMPDSSMTEANGDDSDKQAAEKIPEGKHLIHKVGRNEEAQVILDEDEQVDGTLDAGKHLPIQVKVDRNEEARVILDKNEHVKGTLNTEASIAKVIDLDNDDENPYSKLWHYMDLNQETHGPFSMSDLRKWWDRKFFETDFQVWKTGQTKEEAIFLKDALG